MAIKTILFFLSVLGLTTAQGFNYCQFQNYYKATCLPSCGAAGTFEIFSGYSPTCGDSRLCCKAQSCGTEGPQDTCMAGPLCPVNFVPVNSINSYCSGVGEVCCRSAVCGSTDPQETCVAGGCVPPATKVLGPQCSGATENCCKLPKCGSVFLQSCVSAGSCAGETVNGYYCPSGQTCCKGIECGKDNVLQTCVTGSCPSGQTQVANGVCPGSDTCCKAPGCGDNDDFQQCFIGVCPTGTTDVPSLGCPSAAAKCCQVPQCGFTFPPNTLSPKIFFGSQTAPCDIPWQVGLWRKGTTLDSLTGSRLQCGGTLIGKEWVLTSAVCVFAVGAFVPGDVAEDHLQVVVGDYSLSTTSGKEQILSVSKYVIHPGFPAATSFVNISQLIQTLGNEVLHSNNLALLKLSRPVQLNDCVWPACLPDATMGNEDCKVKGCTMTGWGINADGNPADILQSGPVDLYPKDSCKAITRFRYGKDFGLDGCAKSPALATPCFGDNGGPLTCKDANSLSFVRGTYVLHLNCPGVQTPFEYSDITEATQWIRDEMAK